MDDEGSYSQNITQDCTQVILFIRDNFKPLQDYSIIPVWGPAYAMSS